MAENIMMESADASCQHVIQPGTRLYQTIVCTLCRVAIYLDGCCYCRGYHLGTQAHHSDGCPLKEGRIAGK